MLHIALATGMCLFIAQLLVTNALLAQQTSIFPRLRQPVQHSIMVQRLHDGKILHEENASTLLIPASVSKLITAAAVLDKYGSHTQFTTPIYHTGERKGSTIKGDLIVVGEGDPLIINEKLWQMAADLRHMGLKVITGDLIIDNSLFPGGDRDHSRLAGLQQSSNAYDAPVTAFGVNFNTFPVAIAPSDQIGQPGRVAIDPYPIAGIEAHNQVTTTSAARSNIQVSRQTTETTTLIHVSGQVSQQDQLRKFYRSVGQPARTAGETLRAFLLQEGITLQGSIKEGSLPSNPQLLYRLQGYPISKMIHGLNKFSNNYIADVLTQKLGADYYSRGKEDPIAPGSLQSGSRILEQFLTQTAGIPLPFVLYNGSGLDIRNRLSARQLVQLLDHMAKRLDIFPEFIASLPASGQDGTLSDRFKRGDLSKLHGIIRAKTGTLTRPVTVSSLAGYLHHPQHGLIAFAMIENGVPKKEQPSILDLRFGEEQALLRLWNTWQE